VQAQTKLKQWLKRHGFAAGVILAGVAAIAFGLAVPVPDDLPVPAQNSAALWRVEQAAIAYAFFYLLVLATTLGLKDRGFVEFGPGGVKAGDVAAAQKERQIALEKQAETLAALRDAVAMHAALSQAAVQQLQRELRELEQRLDKLNSEL